MAFRLSARSFTDSEGWCKIKMRLGAQTRPAVKLALVSPKKWMSG